MGLRLEEEGDIRGGVARPGTDTAGRRGQVPRLPVVVVHADVATTLPVGERPLRAAFPVGDIPGTTLLGACRHPLVVLGAIGPVASLVVTPTALPATSEMVGLPAGPPRGGGEIALVAGHALRPTH